MAAARRFTRRTLLKGTAAAGAVAAMGPWIVREARSSSGELNILVWSDEVPDPLIPNFTKKTGIKVNTRRSRKTKSRSTSYRRPAAKASIFASRPAIASRSSSIRTWSRR